MACGHSPCLGMGGDDQEEAGAEPELGSASCKDVEVEMEEEERVALGLRAAHCGCCWGPALGGQGRHMPAWGWQGRPSPFPHFYNICEHLPAPEWSRAEGHASLMQTNRRHSLNSGSLS